MYTMRNIDFRILANSSINAITLYILKWKNRNKKKI
jgi:hypothetical protein